MPHKINKPELLAPAGNFEKLETAILYGADAIYLAGKQFSLRNFSGNFNETELGDAVSFARTRKIKAYVACNIFSRNRDQKPLAEFLIKIAKIRPDAVIISDPGLIFLAKSLIPDIDIHLSTQANTTNYNSAAFWKTIGIKRLNLARELSLEEIQEIIAHCDVETEAFVHGAMCISYSGRCLLSSFLTRRDSNQGLCSHPCRWEYGVVESQRPGLIYPLLEDDRGTYIMNSRDLCMIEHIPELVDSGITSLKIEGRMKGLNYLASVVKTYREAIDAYVSNPLNYHLEPRWLKELAQLYHRDYSTGFFFDDPDETSPNYGNHRKGMMHSFIGKIFKTAPGNRVIIDVKNKVSKGDIIEVVPVKGPPIQSPVIEITNLDGHIVEHGQPNTLSILKITFHAPSKAIVRKI